MAAKGLYGIGLVMLCLSATAPSGQAATVATAHRA
jgi:hypothetical protein